MFAEMLTLEEIRAALGQYEARTVDVAGKRVAAVAIVLRDGVGGEDGVGGPEVLLIERATREGDPWSGHMAFPGGRMDATDRDARAASERETWEEVGLDLAGAELLGRIDDLEGKHAANAQMVISAYAFYVRDPGPLSLLEPEVSDAFWFPLASFLDPETHVDYPMTRYGLGNFPGLRVGEPDRHIVWGLTYKFLEILLFIVDHPLPDRWGDVPADRRPPRPGNSAG